MAENIDELQIEIESDASSALDGLENLTKSLEKLRKAVGGSADTVKGLKTLVPALRSLSKIESLNLTANVNQIKALNSAIKSMNSADYTSFGDKVNTIAGGITQLTNIPVGNISALSGGLKNIVKAYKGLGELNLDFGPQLSAVSGAISTLATTSESLNKVNFETFGKNLETLSGKLQSLQGYKTQASGLLTALRSFPETAAALNDFTGFDQFGDQLGKLKEALDKISGVNGKVGATLDALTRVNQASNSLNAINFTAFQDKTKALAEALGELQNVNTKLGSTLNGLSRVGTVAQELSSAMSSTNLKGDIDKLAGALSGLNRIEKSNLGSVVSQLKQIPNITKSLDAKTLDDFCAAIDRLVVILEPLAKQMESVSRGFSLLPNRMQAAIKATNRTSSSVKNASGSFNQFTNSITRTITKMTVLTFAFRRVWTAMAGAFNESNEYIENLNLFTITMGDATDRAKEFAETVQAAMGIDISQWIENQGVFMRMATGFGIASDKAEVMSQNLTQLAYDMSSFFNADVETAMQKLQSGMSGQIKGLKAWGYNLSVAALQETALSLGIEKSVRKMSEAQKAQLRYITLIQKSYGVMGDMGRTLVTPANALRILNSQLVQLKRAFGDIVSVIATQVLPYVQAFVRLVTDAARELAEFFGFELPKIDYSSLELGADVIDGIGDDLEDTTDKAKELKKQLMGFDELNILKNPDKDDSKNKEVSYDLGIDLPEYDFLGGLDTKTQEATQKIKDMFANLKEEIEAFSPLLTGLANAFIAAFAFNWISGALAKLGAIPAMAGIFLALKKAVVGAALAFNLSKNPFLALGTAVGTLWESFEKFMGGLSPFKKVLVSVVALGVEFGVVKDAVKNFTKGTTSLGKTLLNIVPVCGAVGAAMYAMLGPWGLAAAAATALIAGLVGVYEAQEELQREAGLAAFFDEVGVSITELSSEITQAINDMVGWTDTVISNGEAFEENQTHIKECVTEIGTLTTVMGTVSSEVAAQYIPDLKAAFDDLAKNVAENMNLIRDNLITSLSNTPSEILAGYGTTFEDLANEITNGAYELNSRLEELTSKKDALLAEYEETGNAALLTQISAISEEMAKLSALDLEAVSGFQSAMERMSKEGIDFENVESATQALQGMRDAYDEAVAAVEANTIQLFTDVDNAVKTGMISESTGVVLKDIYFANEESMKAELATQFSQTLAGIELSFADQLDAMVAAEIENASFGDTANAWLTSLPKWLGGDGAEFSEALKATVTDGILESDVGQIFDALLEADTDLHSDLAQYGKDVGLGIAGGLSDSEDDVIANLVHLSDVLKQSFRDENGIHSPSTVYEEMARFIPDGIANGLTANTSVVTDAVRSLASAAISAWKSSMASASFDLPSVSGKRMGYASVGMYASGGFPSTGSMFIANEAGPELVGRIGSKTAVANNDQILQGIASAVYEAMMAAHEDGGSNNNNGGTARIVVQIGDRAVGEAAVEYINGQIVQTGTNPINL